MIIPIENKDFNDFSPCDFGYENCDRGKIFGPYIRDNYLIHFVYSGKGMLKNDRGEHKIKKGEAFLIRPGEVCTYISDKEEPWSYIWIGFTGKISHDFDNVSDVFLYDGFFVDDLFSVAKSKAMIEVQLASMLFKLYWLLFNHDNKIDPVNKIIGYIDANYMNKISIEKAAKMLNIDRKHLARIFKARKKITMQQYLIKKRMTVAMELLEGGYNVGETALMVGYSDGFSFSKAFKSYYNILPSHVKSI